MEITYYTKPQAHDDALWEATLLGTSSQVDTRVRPHSKIVVSLQLGISAKVSSCHSKRNEAE